MARTYRRGYLAAHLTIALCLAVSPVLAQQVLYCVDTAATGFRWDKDGKVRQATFENDRFTVQVLSDNERIITPMTGEIAGKSKRYTCTRPYSGVQERLVCDDGYDDEPWVFFRNTYTHAFTSGPPAGGTDVNIFVTYGTCTKF
jgi:hypothetical protein